MDQIDRILSAPPFDLDGEGRGWVRTTLAGMDRAAKVRQLFVHICFGTGPDVVEGVAAIEQKRRPAFEPGTPEC